MSVYDEHLESEKERLTFTKEYMNHLITVQESGQKALKERQEDTLARLDFKDSSLRYQEMLTHSSFMKLSKDQLENLKNLRKKPYFARIDFHRKEKTDKETFYIGKVSLFDRETQLPIILDWRSPLANVYYEGRLGDVSYEAHGEVYEGNVSLKRQYQIEDGELLGFRDVDLTTKDELLQDSLAQNAEHRLTEIVSTIQEEQNRVIRADLRKPIIVQGAAGSGKTTIALHRISYFLYNMRDIFKPDEMLILAPNRLFIQYISEVLPELGVNRAKQTTFSDFVQHIIQVDWPVVSQHDVLMGTIEKAEEGETRHLQMAGYKGSKAFKQLLDRYIQKVKQTYIVEEDFMLAEFKIKSGANIKRLFLKDFQHFPYEVRVEKIKRVLQSELRRKKKQIIEKVAAKYDDELDKALFGMKDKDKRKTRVSFLITRKEERLNELKKQARTAVSRYMKQFPKHKLTNLYKSMYEEEMFCSLVEEDSTELQYLRKTTSKYLQNKQLHSEDLAPLLYMYTYISGLHADDQVKKVVVDEAQDYSFLEFYSLKKAFQTDLFTIVGDLAQGIYRYRGLQNWESLKEVFRQPSYLTLQKTYRTTIEIMNLANQLLTLMPEDLPKAEPVVRHGPLPAFIEKQPGWKRAFIKVMDQLEDKGMNSFAIVTKTMKEAAEVSQISEISSLNFQTLDEHTEMGDRMILPAYLAKGLEFDVVFLYSEDHPFTKNELDIKVLYVAMTRPLHELYMIGNSPHDFLLDHLGQASYQVHSF
ncbi:AAA family ATPase [Halobacillus shinanisalinarum]|uniref:DNA 3'-5' helicase n=1 Tax=Halobacillus shinanisalinarum TaxID=2932258 RepID=A0ABY4GWW7_9BACI|nr:RNA polymerase recycling motor HelD [Halobacillus shinanisalinarum]UOQ92667.1 AAA family ATPase [Halobacillus shinanisalinarum]